MFLKPGARGKEEKGHDEHQNDVAPPYFKAEADLKEPESPAVVIFKVTERKLHSKRPVTRSVLGE